MGLGRSLWWAQLIKAVPVAAPSDHHPQGGQLRCHELLVSAAKPLPCALGPKCRLLTLPCLQVGGPGVSSGACVDAYPPATAAALPSLPCLPACLQVGGLGMSSATFVDNAEYRLQLYSQLGAESCDMESTAFMQVRRTAEHWGFRLRGYS